MLHHIREFAINSGQLLVFTFKRFMRDGCMYRASALTFTTLLAMVPLMLVGLSIFSAFPVFDTLGDQIQNFIFNNFVPEAGSVVQGYLKQFVMQTTHLSLVSTLFLLVTAVLLLYTIERALNVIWRVKLRRRGLGAFMLYWAVLTLSPIIIGSSMAVSAYVANLSFITDTLKFLGVWESFLHILPILLTIFLFTVLYATIPNCRVPLRYAFLASIVAAIIYDIAKWMFGLYIVFMPTYKLVYGALAVVPLFLLWLYFVWMIILIGAELSYSLTFYRTIVSKQRLPAFLHAFRWLAALWQAQRRGEGLSLYQLVKQDSCRYEVMPEELIDTLVKLHFIQRMHNGKFLLARDLHSISLAELHKELPWKLPEEIDNKGTYSWDKRMNKILIQCQTELDKTLDISLGELLSNTK